MPILQDFCKIKKQENNILKIVLIIVNINKHENKSLISNQFSLENKGNNKITELRTILQRESQNS